MPEKHSSLVEEPTGPSWRREKQVAFLLHFGFLLIGVVTTLLGPILPMLAARWHLGDAEAGWLFTAQFTGGIIGSALSSRMILRLGLLRLMVCGYVITGVAVACLGVSSWAIGLLSVLCSGFALGLTAPAINLLVAEINPERRAAALNILNFAWAIGAVAGPSMIAFLARDGYLVRPLAGLAIMLAGVAFLTARHAPIEPEQPPQKRGEIHSARFGGSYLRAWASSYALLTAGLIFIYVGTETAASGWISTYALRLGTPTSEFGTMMPAIFWAGLLAGRAIAPALLSRTSDAGLVLVGLVTAGVGLMSILAGSTLKSVAFGVGLTGLGLAPVFPTTFAIFTRHFGRRASELTGTFFVMGGLGGALVPWLVGFVSERFGDLRTGLLVPSFGVATMIVLQFFIMRALPHRH
jgi:MFS transporter, FHS family, glucose/mannose:H+ symporter